MKRLIASFALLAVLCLSATAGDIPGSGKQDPPPEPTPTPIANIDTGSLDTDLPMTIIEEIFFAVLRT